MRPAPFSDHTDKTLFTEILSKMQFCNNIESSCII